jgi:RNA polymerase sigma-70 factor (ECF subfamily)
MRPRPACRKRTSDRSVVKRVSSSASSHSDPTGQIPTWEEVARDYGGFIYTVAYRLTGDHPQAQDLSQEVLLRVRKGLETYRPGSMTGWLSRITTNAFLDQTRRAKRRPTSPLPDDSERVIAGDVGADEALERADLPDFLQDALRSIRPDFRVVVVLCDVLGFSYEEIARHVDVPVGTVRSRIHRGRSELREILS